MSRAIGVIPCILAAAAFVACSSGSGGKDDGGYVAIDPGGRIDICYGGQCVEPDVPVATPDGVAPQDGVQPSDVPVATDPGRDGTVAVDNGPKDVPVGQDLVTPTDPGPVDTYVDPGPPCTFPISDWNLQDHCDGTMLDQDTGMLWMKGEGFSATLDGARTYCSDQNKAKLGGYNDWRLPTIDDLRTLIIGCDANTGPNGACPIHHAPAGVAVPSPMPASCLGCGMNQGPVAKLDDPTRKCYMDNTFDWYCNLYWSNTQVPAAFSGDKRAWYVTYYDAALGAPPDMSGMQSAAVKCVRGP